MIDFFGLALDNSPTKELTLAQALELFETVYMPSRNLSDYTRVAYKTDIGQLVAFLGSQGVHHPAAVSLATLQTFMAHLDDLKLTGVSRRRKVAVIKTFFHFLTSNEYIRRDPSRELIPPQREHKEPRFLSKAEYQELVRACSHEPRDAAIIEVVLQTGIRLSEVVRLTRQDVQLPARINNEPDNTGSLRIYGKGKKNRTLPLNYKACRALKTWLAIRPKVNTEALFVTKFGKPLGPRGIQILMQKYLQAAGIVGGHVHTLRHTCATHQHAQGMDLRYVQEMLGHESPATTAIYTTLAKAELARQLQNNAL